MALRSAVQGRTTAPRVARDPSPFIAPQPIPPAEEEEEEESTPPAQAHTVEVETPPAPADRPEVVHAAPALKPSEMKAQLKQLKTLLAEAQAQREQALDRAIAAAEQHVNGEYVPRIRALKDQMLELNRLLIESM